MVSYTYDDANQLTNIAMLNSSSGTISSQAYTLDPASRLTQEVQTWNGGSSSDTITYGYTDNGQLTSVSHTNGSFSNESYSYDDNGNRTMSGYSTDTGNELSSDGTSDYTYDAAGNMTSKTDIATGVETDYVWDDRNRLVEVDQVVSGVNTVLALYTYDALNNPIKVVENGSTRWTAYDGNRPVLDFDGSGTLTARYLQGPMVDEVLARDTPSGGVAWYLPDRLGTVRDIINNSGTVLDHIAYDSYGQILSQSNASAGDRFGYAGMQTDATTGLYFDQARWYDPESGRFISVDPLGFGAGDANLYRYVANQATNAIDPYGLWGDMAPPTIILTPPGRTPFITTNPPKANQSGQTKPNTNPWLSRGGPTQKTGQLFYSSVTLEWVISFNGTPCPGQWGRKVWRQTFWTQDFVFLPDGSVTLRNKGSNDTDPPHDYISGNNVYMYDAPGRAFGSPEFVFQVWAKSCNGKTVTSKWFYVNGGDGRAYEIPEPDYNPPPPVGPNDGFMPWTTF